MAENFHFENNPVTQELHQQEGPLKEIPIPHISNQVHGEERDPGLANDSLIGQPKLNTITTEHVPSADVYSIETVVRTTRQNPTDTQLGELAQDIQGHS